MVETAVTQFENIVPGHKTLAAIMDYAKQGVRNFQAHAKTPLDKDYYNVLPGEYKEYDDNVVMPLSIKGLGPCFGIVIYDPQTKKYTLFHSYSKLAQVRQKISSVSPQSIVICAGGNEYPLGAEDNNDELSTDSLIQDMQEIKQDFVNYCIQSGIQADNIFQYRDTRKSSPNDSSSISILPSSKKAVIKLYENHEDEVSSELIQFA